MPLLEVERLTAGYGEAVVLEEMSLSVDDGEGLAVLGRNGVGKTTLMLAIMGHARRLSGSLRWQGTEIGGTPAYQRARMGLGWVPQERDIFPSLTVEENLLVAGRPGAFGLKDAYDLFPRLKERRRNMGDKLSGGEQQMLAICRTLMTNPRLLLLDEPFEGLAPVIVEELEATLRRLRAEKGFATVIVEQHAEDALALSDRAIVLDRGKIVLEGRSADLLADFAQVRRWIAV
ncbi:ABC transporter ATP-binding protein [Roseomonas indoligenes]|uniref:ABC transporter ATP-binding protein n=1 Tax=Roseomonas indoligenes TaxID=2820811 RepID=A0A940S866_9PROT|nr:ABC transporter ATP-binding protein [Pararoseomonas indoligenes]MBP0495625.1 ABC transporter ATP-binding protein [Pararoseomonas indoligenes]